MPSSRRGLCYKPVHISLSTTTRMCNGWKEVAGGGNLIRLLSIAGRKDKNLPLSVPTFHRPKGFYRPADSNAGTIITS